MINMTMFKVIHCVILVVNSSFKNNYFVTYFLIFLFEFQNDVPFISYDDGKHSRVTFFYNLIFPGLVYNEKYVSGPSIELPTMRVNLECDATMSSHVVDISIC